jgi:hypothetical protein
LYEQRQEGLAALSAAGGSEFEGSTLSTNPVYQNIQIALNETKVEIAGVQSRIVEHTRRVADLREKVDIMPEVEARLAGLVRDYDQVKTMHDELVSRLEQERLGTAAVADDVNFSVIQPPVADFNPTSPDRLLLLVALFAVSVGGGIAIAVGLSQIKPVFSSTRDLRAYIELPVLGAVRAVRSPAQSLLFKVQIAGLCMLVVLFVASFAVGVMLRDESAALLQSLLA